MTARRPLVINADDFGLTPGVCTGILHAHEHGIVTSTSVLAPAPALAGHAGALRDSGLAAGLHLCLVGEDPPVLSAAEIPSLVDERGNFPTSWRSFCLRAVRGGVDQDDVAREFRAQADLVLGLGIELSHVDSHQYVHLWPSVAPTAVALTVELGVSTIRVPGTARWSPTSAVVRRLARHLRSLAASSGLRTPEVSAGLDQAGAMSAASLHGAIRSLSSAEGLADITVHPGDALDPARSRYRWDYSWPDELTALCNPDAARWVEEHGFLLSDYR